jgi:hypothetical protein
MDASGMLAVLARLPDGVSEVYLHPATESGAAISQSMSAYRHVDELGALLSADVRGAIVTAGIGHGGYRDAGSV